VRGEKKKKKRKETNEEESCGGEGECPSRRNTCRYREREREREIKFAAPISLQLRKRPLLSVDIRTLKQPNRAKKQKNALRFSST
jgi:hypothetical protein